MTTWDPEITEDDRGWAEAWLEHEADRCPGCGNPASECRDPESGGRYEVVTQMCQACRVLQAQMESDQKEGGARRGVYYGVRRA